MTDLIRYERFKAAGERGAAPFIAIGPMPAPDAAVQTPLCLYIAFKVDDDETREHFSDIENQIATIIEMNRGVYDEAFDDVDLTEARRLRDR